MAAIPRTPGFPTDSCRFAPLDRGGFEATSGLAAGSSGVRRASRNVENQSARWSPYSVAETENPAVERRSSTIEPPTARHLVTGQPVEVSKVRSRVDHRDFIELPRRIYATDPQWVPPLEREVKAFIDPQRHPFYEHGAAIPLIARRGNETVGRILVSDDPRYNEQHGANVGCFGMFECIDDVEVAKALFDTAAAWLRQRGRTSVMGPIDYSTNYPCGLLIDGFGTPPRVMMNHHRPYYRRLLEAWGMTKAKDLYAWWFDDSQDMLQAWGQRAERLAARGKVTIRPLNFRDFDNEVARCMKVYNESWDQSWGFVKMTQQEFVHLARQLQQVAVPGLLLLAEIGEEPVGFSMTLPDINEAIRPLNGRLTTWGLPIGLARLAYRMRRIKTGRMAVLGVRDAFRRRGVTEMLILRTLDYGKNVLGYTGAELSWTLEDNDLINRAIEKVGARRYKTYRILERVI